MFWSEIILRMKISEDDGEQENPSTNPKEYDFASLIIPNKVYRSKLAKLKSNFVLPKNGNNKNKPQPDMKPTVRTDINAPTGLIIPTHNSQSKSKVTEYRNGVIIEEL